MSSSMKQNSVGCTKWRPKSIDGKEDTRDLELEETQPLTSPSSSHSTSDEETTLGKTINIQKIYNTSRRILNDEHVDFALFALGVKRIYRKKLKQNGEV